MRTDGSGCINPNQSTKSYDRRPHGCLYCAGRGLKGRTGLFEFFKPDAAISSAIASGASESEIAEMRRARGEPTLFEDGLSKCLAGITTLKEVHRVAGAF